LPHASFPAIANEQILSLCCNYGEEWGQENTEVPCSTFNGSLELVPVELHGLCLSAVEICCSKQHKIYQCSAGQYAARQGLSCALQERSSGSEFFTDCCEACKIGLVVGISFNKCSMEPFAFGTPWDEVYESCCMEIKRADSFIIPKEERDYCSQYKECSQLCDNLEDTFVCKCYDGYTLLEDSKTCVRMDDEDDNFILGNATEYVEGVTVVVNCPYTFSFSGAVKDTRGRTEQVSVWTSTSATMARPTATKIKRATT
jgi:fibulin 1/2